MRYIGFFPPCSGLFNFGREKSLFYQRKGVSGNGLRDAPHDGEQGSQVAETHGLRPAGPSPGTGPLDPNIQEQEHREGDTREKGPEHHFDRAQKLANPHQCGRTGVQCLAPWTTSASKPRPWSDCYSLVMCKFRKDPAYGLRRKPDLGSYFRDLLMK